jgi:hypothetical protein
MNVNRPPGDALSLSPLGLDKSLNDRLSVIGYTRSKIRVSLVVEFLSPQPFKLRSLCLAE